MGASNNEANVIDFNTKGKHIVQATVDLAPTASLTADIEIDMSQPSSLGDLTIFEKTIVELTAPKQKISANAKIVSPVYTTSLTAELEGDAPVFKVTFKSTATSVFVILDYDLDSAIVSTLNDFGEKYQFFGQVSGLKSAIVNLVEETYTTVNNQAPELSQLSILFRNTVGQYQKTVQVFLDTAVKFLRETQFKLPGSDEMTTLPEVLKKLTSTFATVLEKAIQMMLVNAELTFNAMVDMLSNIQVTMPIGDVMSGAQMIDRLRDTVKGYLNQVVDLVKNMESLDMILEKLGETLKVIVDKAQEFVDSSLKSDTLDAIAIYINAFYGNLVTLLKKVMDQANVMDMEYLNGAIDYVMEVVRSAVALLSNTVSEFMQKAPASFQEYVKVEGGRLEIDLPFYLRQ